MLTVLVVEDEWAIADWLQSLLDEEGYSVMVAGDGRRALELIAHRPPDLVITDFMMPVMDGAAFVRAMHRDGHAAVPVIVMSSLPEEAVKARLDGHRAFLRKPFREAELLQTIRRVLDSGTARS